MASWRWRKSIGLGKLVRVNLSRRGAGVSVGVPGARVGTGTRGAYTSVSVPGTGLYKLTRLGRKRTNSPPPLPNSSTSAGPSIESILRFVVVIAFLLLAAFVIIGLAGCTQRQPIAAAPAPTIASYVHGLAAVDEIPETDEATLWTYQAHWDRMVEAWGESSSEEIFDSCMAVHRAKSFYPEITMLNVMERMAASLPTSKKPGEAGADLYAALESEYYEPIMAAAEQQAAYDAAVQQQIADNQAAARDRGAARNQSVAEWQRQANQNQAALQERARSAPQLPKIGASSGGLGIIAAVKYARLTAAIRISGHASVISCKRYI